MSRPFTSKNNKDDNKGRSRKPDTDKSKFKPKFSKPSESRGAEDRPKRSYTKREDSNAGGYEKRPYTKRDDGDRGGSSERRSFSKPERGGYEDRPKRTFTKREDAKPEGYEKRPYTKRDDGDRRDSNERRGYSKPERGGYEDRPKRTFTKREDAKPGGYEKRPYTKRDDGDRGGSSERKNFSRPERGGFEDRPKRPFTKREDSNSGGYEKRPYTKRDDGDRRDSNERKSFSRPERGGYEDRPKRPYTKREDTNKDGFEKRTYAKREDSDSRSKDWAPKGKRTVLKEEPIKLKSRKSAGDESDFYPENINVSIRLNRFLSNAGVASRREADVMITAGLVKVNGKIVTELGTKVNPQLDEISYGDARVKVEKKVYVLINKPKNVITTTDDPEGRNTIMELVKDATKERIFPVGRLDRNTTGVLLLTNDGDLSNKLTHPKFGIKKVYIAQLDKNFKLADKQKLLEGVELEDGPIHADALEFKSTDDKKTLFVEIHSGRNRIVHRMFESLGYKVDKLDRTYFAGLTKTSLKRGQWRLLSEQEVNILRRQ